MKRSFLDLAAFERRILIFLFGLMILVQLIRDRRREIQHSWPQLRFAELVAQLDSLEASQSEADSRTLRIFDPNRDSEEELIAKGVRPVLASNMVNYRTRIHAFRTPKDLGKLYRILPGELERLLPYVRIEQKEQVADRGTWVCTPVQLNVATDSLLVAHWQVSAHLAKRIVSYRDLLGGYVQEDQLAEVYGLTSGMYERVETCIALDEGTIRRINLQRASFKEMLRHPYLSLEMVKQLTAARAKVEIQSWEQLGELPAWDSAAIRRIAPYIQWMTH